ncbi:MAG: cobalamin-dependent protein [Actinobacteria bacterium]|nr:cobalamin-dependent protein [Actinomycetota bacterium]
MGSEILNQLKKMVMDFDIDNAENLAKEALTQRTDPLRCAEALTDGIKEIGEGFEKGDLFLPDLVAASEVLKRAFPVINDAILKKGEKTKSLGKVVIGTVSGDIHSIGKEMVGTLLFASGFEVIDLGVNVGSETFIEAIKKNKANVLAMSALLTTTAMEQKNVIEKLKKEGLRESVKIIVGGAPINKEFADSIGADGYGATAIDGVAIVKELLSVG